MPLTTDHVTALFVASAGVTVAVSCSVPLSVVIVVAPLAPVTVILVTGMNWLVMVITSVPVTPDPSLAVATAVTVPLVIAVTSPVLLIVACPVPLTIDHVTVLFVASEGVTVAVSWSWPLSVPMTEDPPAPVTVIPVTGITWPLMVMTSDPTTPLPSLAVALAVTVPFAYCSQQSCAVDRGLARAIND